MKRNIFLVGFFVVLAALFYHLHQLFPEALRGTEASGNFIYFIIILIPLILSIFRSNIPFNTVLASATGWLGLALLCIILYSYQYEIAQIYNRVLGNLAPSLVQTNQDGSVVIHSSQNGHFQAQALVNGARVNFLIDTGASSVVLTPKAAQAAGVDLSGLNYNILVETANGASFTAPIILDNVKIGDIEVRNVKASVSRDNLDISLLGMTFLTRLKGYEVEQGQLTMYR